MVKSAAIVAHFDVNNLLEENFQQMIACLVQAFDSVILVSTSNLSPTDIAGLGPKVITLLRPNFGYDFYSYRVGIQHALQYTELEQLVLVNSSFVVCDSGKFSQTLQTVLGHSHQNDVVGITESRQFNWHLQSYLLLLGRRLFRSPEFTTFISKIRPLNSKLEVILAYELGLSTLINGMQLTVHALFQPNWQTRFIAYYRWLRILIRSANLGKLAKLEPLHHIKEVNWTHFGAQQLAHQFGLIKTEVLRNNPHQLPIQQLYECCSTQSIASIQRLLEHSRRHYNTNGSGLSTLKSDAPCVPEIRLLSLGKPHAAGIRIAVVLHLYYSDLLDEICGYLQNIIEPFDLYITTPFEGDINEIFERTSQFAHSVTICITENCGRDIGPFLALYRSGQLDGYLATLKLHSKKSKYSDLGSVWRNRLYTSLLGDSLKVRRILQLFEDRSIGVLGPHTYYLTSDDFWGANQLAMERLLRSMNMLDADEPARLGFFAGSMFWFSPAALAPLKRLSDKDLTFEPEAGMQDGTLAHAIERIFCELARKQGYITTSTELAGGEIGDTETGENRVPVL
ncbi:rhamnan synthesis F family protein [Pseudomonas nicosulfuronedens]